MGSQNQLFDIADRQQGFFAAKQAEECGYTRFNFHFFYYYGIMTVLRELM